MSPSLRAGPRPLPTEREGLVVGRVDDGDVLEALVVEIGGTTDRPDGSTYHVTWPLDRARGREPVQSNEVLGAAQLGGAAGAGTGHADPRPLLMHLFLDCDGVLADFDRAAAALLSMPPGDHQHRFDPAKFWARIEAAPDFYGALPLVPDARLLFESVTHLRPTILTGCSRDGWAEAQKVRWATRHFPSTPIINCMARDKRDHGRDGDILVDDTLTHHLWEGMGGVFVHHRDARSTLDS